MATDRARAQLQAWRADGADRLDPLRFGLLEALAARVPQHAGQAREVLEQRLVVLLQAYAKDLERMPGGARTREPAAGKGSALGELLAGMARSGDMAAARGEADARAVAADRSAPMPVFEPLPVLDELRTVWSRMRNDNQLRQSLEQMPEDAGPLNSEMLVHRALQLMQATAPGYLQHFIAYADVLSSLQQLREGNVGGTGETAAAAGRKPARARSRKRTG